VVVQKVVLDLEIFPNLEQNGKGDVEGLDCLVGRGWARIHVWNPGHMHGKRHREIERIEGGLVDDDQSMPGRRSDDTTNSDGSHTLSS
jgi:hypothetical protein